MRSPTDLFWSADTSPRPLPVGMTPRDIGQAASKLRSATESGRRPVWRGRKRPLARTAGNVDEFGVASCRGVQPRLGVSDGLFELVSAHPNPEFG